MPQVILDFEACSIGLEKMRMDCRRLQSLVRFVCPAGVPPLL